MAPGRDRGEDVGPDACIAAADSGRAYPQRSHTATAIFRQVRYRSGFEHAQSQYSAAYASNGGAGNAPIGAAAAALFASAAASCSTAGTHFRFGGWLCS